MAEPSRQAAKLLLSSQGTRATSERTREPARHQRVPIEAVLLTALGYRVNRRVFGIGLNPRAIVKLNEVLGCNVERLRCHFDGGQHRSAGPAESGDVIEHVPDVGCDLVRIEDGDAVQPR